MHSRSQRSLLTLQYFSLVLLLNDMSFRMVGLSTPRDIIHTVKQRCYRVIDYVLDTILCEVHYRITSYGGTSHVHHSDQWDMKVP